MPQTSTEPSNRQSSRANQKRFLLISIVLFVIILIGGSIGFVYSMKQIVHANKRTELLQLVELQRYSLEASVNHEISIVLEMANSPTIIQHFLNPYDMSLRRIAFDEIARFTGSLMSNSAFWVNDIDKMFYLGEDTHYILDPEDPESYWYKMTMYETEIYNFNINYNPDLRVTNFWINAPVFDSGGKPIGILGTGINLTEFINTIYRSHRGKEDIYFFNAAGEITGATDMKLVEEKVTLEKVLAATGPEILTWARNDTSENMRAFYGPEGEIAVCPIPAVGWDIVAVQPLNLWDYLNTGMTYLFLAIMGVIVIFFVILQIGKYALDTLNRTRRELRVERDLIATMKDNLSAGLFLMDKNFVIQPSYSKSLEDILGTREIAGKKMTSFLASSVTAKERDTIEDYFTMVLTRQFDAKMLEEVNPIIEFAYADESTKKEKILKTAFTAVDMGSNEFFLMGTMEDISATKELQRQLAAETKKREEEMQTLFQVIQIDPVVFGEFIEDIEFEFDHIKDALKNTSASGKDTMVDIFQSVHAIKSNAVILGLDNFGAKLHELENIIKNYRDGKEASNEVYIENIVHVTVELEKIMKEKDKFREIINRIKSFKTTTAKGNARKDQFIKDQFILIETLTNACKKAASAQNKKVDFLADNMTALNLEKNSRRALKEVLTQLVRNSVYHGIEAPEDRIAIGKKDTGVIRLSITEENNQVHINFSDNGRGLDFQKIRNIAIKQKLLSEEDADNENLRFQAIFQAIFSPGFSTAESADINAGRGIGLNLVKDRIDQLNGRIKLSSENGKGTVFDFYIPTKVSAKAKSTTLQHE